MDQQVIDVLILFDHKRGDRSADQLIADHSQQRSHRKIGLLDQPLVAQGAIAHRRQIIQIEIARPGQVEFHLGPVQFLVLQFKLHLVNLQFMKGRPNLLERERFQGLRLHHLPLPQFFLGLPAQGTAGCIFRRSCGWNGGRDIC